MLFPANGNLLLLGVAKGLARSLVGRMILAKTLENGTKGGQTALSS